MTPQVKLLPSTSMLHICVDLSSGCTTSHPVPCWCGESRKDVSSLWAPSIHMGNQSRVPFLALGFSLAQLLLLHPFEGWTSVFKILSLSLLSLSISLFLYLVNKSISLKKIINSVSIWWQQSNKCGVLLNTDYTCHAPRKAILTGSWSQFFW